MKVKNTFHVCMFAALLLLWGCLESPLNLQIRYADVSGLKQGDPVYFENNTIGKVEKVTYTQQGDYLVAISIVTEFKNAATVDSRFYIDNDIKDQQGKAITVVQEKPGGGVIEKGLIVQGSVRPGFLEEMVSTIKRSTGLTEEEMRRILQQLKDSLQNTSEDLGAQMESALDDLSARLQRFNEEIQKVPDSAEVKELEQSVKTFADEFHKAHKDLQDKLRHEILPQLQYELEVLREKLERIGREKEVEEIDRELKGMNTV